MTDGLNTENRLVIKKIQMK